MPDPRKKIQLLIASLEELRLHVGRKDLAVGKQKVNALLFFSLANACLRGRCVLLYGGMGANKTTLVNLLGWKRLADQCSDLMPLDRVVLGFLRDYWGAALPSCSRPEVSLLERVFSPGVRDKSLWQRQCRQTAKILEILNGSANNAPLNCAASLDIGKFEEVLAVLGLKGELKRWYRDKRRRAGSRPRAQPCPICLSSWTAAAPWRGQRWGRRPTKRP